jgi:hypothetical protein
MEVAAMQTGILAQARQNRSLVEHLESHIYWVDGVLARHGLEARVAGGYVAGSGLLLSLSKTVFANNAVCQDVSALFGGAQVLATVGVIMIHGYQPQDTAVEPVVETMDVMQLIAEREQV